MIYDTFAHYTKSIGHMGVELSFPSNPFIAMASAGGGYVGNRIGEAFGSDIINFFYRHMFGYQWGLLASFSSTPELRPYVLHAFTAGATLTTSVVLNVLSIVFFACKEKMQKNKTPPLPAEPPVPEVRIDIKDDAEKPKEILCSRCLEAIIENEAIIEKSLGR